MIIFAGETITISAMTINEPELVKQLKAGICNKVELSRYLLNHYSAPLLADALAEELIKSQSTKPIVITKEEFAAHFRVQGYRVVDGKLIEEARGNYSKK